MELFETTIQEYYMPMVDKIVKRHFPDYHWKITNLPKDHKDRIGLEPLDDDEVVMLYKRYKEQGDIKARDRMIYSQLSLVCYFTRSFYYNVNGTRLSPEDLLGFANYILIKLIDTYNPFVDITEEEYKNGGQIKKLPSYVQTFMQFALHKELKNYGLEIRLPHNRINAITDSKKLISKFANRYGREPYDGDSITYKVKSNDSQSNYIWYRATFNLYDNEIIIEKKVGKTMWQYDKKIPLYEQHKMISGNSAVGDEEADEFFDLLEGDYNITMDNTQYLLKESIESFLNTLPLREREYVDLFYFQNKAQEAIPTLLTPDYNSKKELKRLNLTSKNEINIYIRVNGEEKVLSYNITANFHTEKSQDKLIDLEYILPINHECSDICTNNKSDYYNLQILTGEIIKVEHVKYSGTNEIAYKLETIDGKQYLQFNVEYSYGEIFTSQSFKNKHKILTKKIRQQMKYLKTYRYE
jgi:DNA-directed RNA polymerase sigma subunit (sigma70/sigma32)